MDEAILDKCLSHSEHQSQIQKHLHKAPLSIGPSLDSLELLRLGYAGCSFLSWAPYANLSYEAIARALKSDQLSGATALAICIDGLDGSPTPFLEAILRHKALREVCFLQEPTRASDEPTSKLFAEICASAPALLGTKKLHFSCAFSAPLRKRFWLPDPMAHPSYTPPLGVFPVQYMFVRKQASGGPNPLFRPYHYFLGDALLHPERAVTGFLKYCRSVVKDRYLHSFASASPDCRSYIKTSGHGISPLPAENFAIPERCSAPGTSTLECWPILRHLSPGSWVLLVSQEWYIGKKDPSASPDYVTTGLPFIRYSFIRFRRSIPLGDSQRPVGPEYVEVVGGAEEFLRETASESDLDESIMDAVMDSTEKRMVVRPWRKLKRGMRYVSTLAEYEARSIFGDFVDDAAFVRENVRQAMLADPGMSISNDSVIFHIIWETVIIRWMADFLKDRDWYPELLEENEGQGGPVSRHGSVFTDQNPRPVPLS